MLKQPDEFMTLSSQAITFVKDHKRQFDYLGLAVLGLIIIYLGWYAYVRYINNKGQDAYNNAYYTMLKNTDTAKDQENQKKKEELFNRVINDYGSSKAARLAVPQLADAKFAQKKYDEAIAKYEEYLGKLSENDPYQYLTMLSLSVCYEEKGDYEKAIQSLEKIIAAGTDDFFKEQAMLSLARVYRLSGKQDKSNETLKQFKEKFPKSVFLELADAFMKS